MKDEYSKSDFATLCGLRLPQIHTAVFSKNIIVNENGKISLNDERNNAFYKQSINNLKQVEEDRKRLVEKEGQPTNIDKVVQKTNPEPYEDDLSHMDKFDLDKKKKQLEIRLKREEVAIKKVQLAKLHGTVIPTELVKVIFSQHFRSITTAFHQAATNLMADLTARHGLSKEEQAQIKGDLIKIVNAAVKAGVDESKKNIDNIINEYSSKFK